MKWSFLCWTVALTSIALCIASFLNLKSFDILTIYLLSRFVRRLKQNKGPKIREKLYTQWKWVAGYLNLIYILVYAPSMFGQTLWNIPSLPRQIWWLPWAFLSWNLGQWAIYPNVLVSYLDDFWQLVEVIDISKSVFVILAIE